MGTAGTAMMRLAGLRARRSVEPEAPHGSDEPISCAAAKLSLGAACSSRLKGQCRL